MAAVRSKKSTNVRSTPWALRAGFAAGEVVAPWFVARLALRLWLTAPHRADAGTHPPGGTPFAVASQGHLVRGTSWGNGPVVYLVHGWGGHARQLDGFVAPLTERGYRVVSFDGPSHGTSDPGPSGPGRSHGIEFGKALDDVAATFGPADAVVAHSMGAMATLLAMRHGWLGTRRLVFVAPMHGLTGYLDQFQTALRIGRRTRRRLDALIESHVGHPVRHFDLAGLGASMPEEHCPLLVVHDRGDRQTPFASSRALVDQWRGATFRPTEGLGHSRVLADPGVVAHVVRFVVDRPVADAA